MADALPDAEGWGEPAIINEGNIIARMGALDADGVEEGASYYLSGAASDGNYDLVILVEQDGSFALSLVSGDWDSAYLAGVESWIAKINDGTADYREDIATSGVEQAAYEIAADIDAVLAYEKETVESPYLALWDGSYSVSSSQKVEGGTYLHSYREVKNESGEVLGRGYLTNTTNVGGKWGDLQLRQGRRPRQRAEPSGRDGRIHRVGERRRLLRGHRWLRALERDRRHRDRA